MSPPTRGCGVQERLSLRAGVSLARTRDGAAYLLTRDHLLGVRGVPVGAATPGRLAVLRQLATTPATRAELLQVAVATGDGAGLADQVQSMLQTLRRRGWLVAAVSYDGRPLYTVVPNRRGPADPASPAPTDLVLSRFAALHPADDGLVLESPRSWCEVRLHDASLLAEFSRLNSTGAAPADPPRSVRDGLRQDLWLAGLATSAASPDGLTGDRDASGADAALWQWSRHELWFHNESRAAPSLPPSGSGPATLPADPTGQLQAVRDPFPGPSRQLPEPNLTVLRATDPSLTSVLEDRRTFREHDDEHPLTLDQLGHFLFRCARNRRVIQVPGVEQVSRPYPSGGSLYELEIYPVVRRVDGVTAGMYHYDPARHRLETLSGVTPAVRRMLRTATLAAANHEPQVLLVIAARFGRIAWKYRNFSYALMLKDVGVLYQMMYSVATAMELAPCGLGYGDPHAFDDATGLDPLVEGSVGEFALGSRLRQGSDS